MPGKSVCASLYDPRYFCTPVPVPENRIIPVLSGQCGAPSDASIRGTGRRVPASRHTEGIAGFERWDLPYRIYALISPDNPLNQRSTLGLRDLSGQRLLLIRHGQTGVFHRCASHQPGGYAGGVISAPGGGEPHGRPQRSLCAGGRTCPGAVPELRDRARRCLTCMASVFWCTGSIRRTI